MSKRKQKEVITNQKSYEILSAKVTDDFCEYVYEITNGVGLGDRHSVKGKGIVQDDLKESFGKFNVHLAYIDDVFTHSGIEVERIEDVVNHELSAIYNVTGFVMKGNEESPSIILKGTKYINSGGRIELETPKINIDSFSSYKWYNELKEAADNARNEVALYKEGKCTLQEDLAPNENQATLSFDGDDDTFKAAKQ